MAVRVPKGAEYCENTYNIPVNLVGGTSTTITITPAILTTTLWVTIRVRVRVIVFGGGLGLGRAFFKKIVGKKIFRTHDISEL
jgi:ribulose 1,5-bisphosphate synthetase/thiazole synthase